MAEAEQSKQALRYPERPRDFVGLGELYVPDRIDSSLNIPRQERELFRRATKYCREIGELSMELMQFGAQVRMGTALACDPESPSLQGFLSGMESIGSAFASQVSLSREIEHLAKEYANARGYVHHSPHVSDRMFAIVREEELRLSLSLQSEAVDAFFEKFRKGHGSREQVLESEFSGRLAKHLKTEVRELMAEGALAEGSEELAHAFSTNFLRSRREGLSLSESAESLLTQLESEGGDLRKGIEANSSALQGLDQVQRMLTRFVGACETADLIKDVVCSNLFVQRSLAVAAKATTRFPDLEEIETSLEDANRSEVSTLKKFIGAEKSISGEGRVLLSHLIVRYQKEQPELLYELAESLKHLERKVELFGAEGEKSELGKAEFVRMVSQTLREIRQTHLKGSDPIAPLLDYHAALLLKIGELDRSEREIVGYALETSKDWIEDVQERNRWDLQMVEDLMSAFDQNRADLASMKTEADWPNVYRKMANRLTIYSGKSVGTLELASGDYRQFVTNLKGSNSEVRNA